MLMAKGAATLDGRELIEQQPAWPAGAVAAADVLAVGGQEDPHGRVPVLGVVKGGDGEQGHIDVVQPPIPIPGGAEGGGQVGRAQGHVPKPLVGAGDDAQLGWAALPGPGQPGRIQSGDQFQGVEQAGPGAVRASRSPSMAACS
jgi:hypothetical protein